MEPTVVVQETPADNQKNANQPRTRVGRRTWLLFVLLACVALTASPSFSQPRGVEVPEVVAPAGEFVQVFETARESTVRIEARARDGFSNGPIGIGTGFFISPEGLVMTAYHVVDSTDTGFSSEIDYVAIDLNENEYPLELISFDAFLDVALLQARLDTPVNFLPISMDTPRVGTDIVAIGNSRGDFLEGRAGRVSRIGVDSPEVRFANNTVELTAALQPGDSGGPVVDSKGEVIGVVSYISYRPDNLTSQGEFVPPVLRGFTLPDFAAYAVPLVNNNNVLEALLLGEQRDIPVIGFSVGLRTSFGPIQEYDPSLIGEGFPDLGRRAGVIVGRVQENGPASLAGFKDIVVQGEQVEADVIVAVDGIATPTFPSLLEVLYEKGVGQTVEVSVQRGKTTLRFALELGAKRQVFN